MRRFIHLFSLLALLALAYAGYDSGGAPARPTSAVAAPAYAHRLAPPHHEGTVVSSEDTAVRLVHSRSQRFSPSSGQSWKRCSGKWAASFFHKFHSVNSYGGRWLPLSGRRQPVLSCEYYVFALRRILC